METGALLFVAAYLIGSIPFGVLFARARGVDIMRAGSGNIGATNVFRTLGTGPGLAVFVLDAAKGWLPVFVAMRILHDPFQAFIVGVGAFVGHCYSPYLRFRGGKGVATALGALFGVSPFGGVVALLTFAIVVAITRYVSVASIVATAAVLGSSFVIPTPDPLRVAFGVLFLFILVKHRANLARLMQGTEPKIGRPQAPMPDRDANDSSGTSVTESPVAEGVPDPANGAPTTGSKG